MEHRLDAHLDEQDRAHAAHEQRQWDTLIVQRDEAVGHLEAMIDVKWGGHCQHCRFTNQMGVREACGPRQAAAAFLKGLD